MARRRRHRRVRRNPSRNQWIAIGIGSAVVLAGTTIYVVRRRRRPAITGDGGMQGGGAPGSGSPSWQHKADLNALCQQPGSMSLQTRQNLVNGVFIPAMNRELAKFPNAQLGPGQVEAVVANVADMVTGQACQPVTPQTRALAVELARAAWLRTSGLTGQ